MTNEDRVWSEEDVVASLSVQLDRAAGTLVVPRPPVAAMIRDGRARRRRRRAATALGAAVVVAGTVPFAWGAFHSGTERSLQPPASTVGEFSGSARVVQPYEAFDIGAGLQMTLKEDGYLALSGGELPRSAAEDTGPSFSRPEEPTFTYPGFPLPHGRLVLAGMLPGEEMPTRVEAEWGGTTHAARIVTLPGEPGWYAIHADLGSGDAGQPVTITVFGAEGEVLDRLHSAPAAG
ncbi:hypothetical protein [Streptomyces hoynatensis]|uniref:Uncharacterized protein n=1 Tax=Streptomyces hoynatensis TaxID=1141874 RepID=A0A3A9YRA1_9ACTN|nr:hypothetical protein [Streptomyces hoynatensis]RKN38513.1 hypothetical protein D7294_23845 [Streptomyces hoynatensis]